MKTDNNDLYKAIAEKKNLLKEKYGMLDEGSSSSLPPELHLDWLDYIIEFEEKWANANMTTVAERLGNISFPPPDELNDEQLVAEWDRLQQLMSDNNLDLCTINDVPDRELYRFTVEELFAEEIVDIRIYGMTTHFIYEEFYPDEEDEEQWD